METLLDKEISNQEKTTPLCPVFGRCGGCQYQDVSYSDELKVKEKFLRDLFLEHISEAVFAIEPIVASPQEYYYRHRVDLKLDRLRSGGVLIGFSPFDNGPVIPVDECFIARREISRFISQVKKEAIEKLTPKYRQANLVVRTSDDGRVVWGGMGKKSLTLNEPDYLWTEIKGKKVYFSLDTFFQANLFILDKLFDTLHSLNLWDSRPVFYDLYGGVGLFGVGLNDKVSEVVLIENHHASLDLAKYNVVKNNLSHFKIMEGTVEAHLPKLLTEIKGESHVAMIDPPRDGLSSTSLKILSEQNKIKNILYLSCNPQSLIRDMKIFTERGWKMVKVVPFDFFPKTRHLETLVLLSRQ